MIVDAGANTGQWISALLRFADVEKADLFEPNPEAFQVLQSKFADDPRIRLRQTALGEGPDRMRLNVTGSSDLASLLTPAVTLVSNYSFQAARVAESIVVEVAALDDCMESTPKIDLLKIDVQGFERFVLKGAAKTLAKTRAIMIEVNYVPHYEGESSFCSLYSQITDELGFELWDLSPPERSREGRVLWADAIFVRREAVSDQRSAVRREAVSGQRSAVGQTSRCQDSPTDR